MLGIDIAALSQDELRRMLAVARAREQHALVARLTAELEARPGRWAKFGAPQPLALPIAPATPAAPPRRRSVGLAVAAAAGAAGVVAAAVVWNISAQAPSSSERPIRVAAPRAAMAIAHPAPKTIDVSLAEAPTAEAAPSVQPIAAAPPPAPAPARRAGHNPCYDLATPADRLVCGYPSLAQRERRLIAAYDAAIAAGADPRALEGEQATWKADRDGVSDRLALADLYDKRIRELSETAP